jgi:hypothetical protein
VIIHPSILDDITADVRQMLEVAAAAHVETGRKSTITLRLTINRDRETQKRQVRARVSAVIPEGVEDSHTRKGEPSLLLSVSDDHPGQTRLEGTEP